MLTRAFAVAVVLAGAFYLLLIDNTYSPELYTAVVAILLSATGFELARSKGLRGGAPRLRWIARSGRAIAAVPGDTFRVSGAVVRQLFSPGAVQGSLRAVPFRYGEAEDPADIARRALAEGVGSLTPNTIVIGIDEERNLILVHQLRRSGGRESVDVLGLG